MALILPKRLRAQSESHARSPVQEREIAKRVRGRVTKGSGSGQHDKGDVRVKGVALIEAKTTKHKSFSVTAELIDKVEGHARMSGEVPIIHIEIEGGKRRCVVMPDWALDILLQPVAGD